MTDAAPGPWEMGVTEQTDEGAAVDAIARGLRSLGYEDISGSDSCAPDWSWPEWALAVYYAVEADDETGVAAVRAVSELPPEDREALVAADALGGSEAARGILCAQGIWR